MKIILTVVMFVTFGVMADAQDANRGVGTVDEQSPKDTA